MNSASKPPRQLGLFAVIMLVMGNMIGSGIIMMPTTLAPYGTLALVGWGISGAGAMVLAWIFSRLSLHIPESGGIFAFSRQAFGDYVGFQVAWIYWCQTWIGNTAIVVGAVAYLSLLWPEMAYNPTLAMIVAQAILWAITGVNLISLRAASLFQTVTTLLKLLPLLMIVGVGLWALDSHIFSLPQLPTPATQNTTTLEMINRIVLLTFWTFIGLECAGVAAESVRRPSVTIPRATLIATGLTVAFYLLTLAVVFSVVPQAELATSQGPFAVAAARLMGASMGPLWQTIIGIGAVISAVGVLNGWILIQGQMPLAAAEAGLLPSAFMRVSSSGVPYVGIVVSSCCISLFLFLGMGQGVLNLFEMIITLATLGILICYLFAVCALLVLHRQGKLPAEVAGRGTLILAVIGALYVIYALYGAGAQMLGYVTLFFLMSTLLYALGVARRGAPVLKN